MAPAVASARRRRRRRRRVGRRPRPASPAASGSAGSVADARAQPARRRRARHRRPARPPSGASRRRRPRRRRRRPPTGNTQLPTEGEIGEIVNGAPGRARPDRRAGLAELDRRGRHADLINQAIILILVGSLGILRWITYRFRDVKFGVTALVALLHDVIVVVGIFAILGTFFGVEIDALFVTAMLTVIGFSVHDTIVVFDRIRENRARHAGEPFAEIVNHSILQTFARSITTSFTVVLTLLRCYLFGGAAIRNFVLALLIGIISGTYSSIFNASPLLVVWQEWEDRRLGRTGSSRAPRTRRAAS